jgi:hypothetical protein
MAGRQAHSAVARIPSSSAVALPHATDATQFDPLLQQPDDGVPSDSSLSSSLAENACRQLIGAVAQRQQDVHMRHG